jgi:uncharacterized membrane protein YqjE
LARLAILGVVVLIIGTNFSLGVIVFALAGGMGPISLLQALFFAGIAVNFVGFAIVVYSILCRWNKKSPKRAD